MVHSLKAVPQALGYRIEELPMETYFITLRGPEALDTGSKKLRSDLHDLLRAAGPRIEAREGPAAHPSCLN
jgi:hypothetical protein